MNVKNVIKLACDFVELQDLKDDLEENLSTTQQAQLDELVKCLNWVYEEIATEYFPLVEKESVNAEGFLAFSDLEKDICFVQAVLLNGAKKDFETFYDGVRFEGNIDQILYGYIPQVLSFDSDVFCYVPERVVAYGVAREYFLQRGISDKAIAFNSRFYDSVKNFVRNSSSCNKIMPARKWL